ncbi:MAG TPA: hypothetical protein VMW36_10820 [Patescibacteria group bacterium]|nr:hypothetical protein [Patescibacteria group bacterium]
MNKQSFSSLSNALDQLQDNVIPGAVLERAIRYFESIVDKRVREVRSKTVSKSTRQWRRAQAARNKTVETFKGRRSKVKNNARVGNRTGVFLDLLASMDPMVIRKHIQVILEGDQPGIEFSARILSKSFAKVNSGPEGYPDLFHEYLVRKHYVPSEGILSLDDDEANHLFNLLQEDLMILWSSSLS